MAAALTHRGPDDSGLWVDQDGRVAFGHQRLAVVDLSPLGHQPMTSPDGRWVISYNGEVYNFKDLRRRLVSEGLAFRGKSDTEVLLGAVQCWGVERALDASEGMFAMALWDRHLRELHLARDRQSQGAGGQAHGEYNDSGGDRDLPQQWFHVSAFKKGWK